MRFTPLQLGSRARRPMVGVAAAAWLLLSSPSLSPQEPSSAAERDAPERAQASLVVDHPVYLPVRPPPAYLEAVRRGTRSESGRPGPEYWQQEVDYDLDVELVPSEALLRGRGTVNYTNRSPHALNGVIVRLYQNVFREGVPRNRAVEPTGGLELARVEAGGRELEELAEEDVREAAARGGRPPAGYLVEGTLAQVILPEPLAPAAAAEFGFEWSFRVPGEDAFRMGHIARRVFNVAQWYPQLATLDDVQGLDTTPYLGDGEFYLEYGSFSVEVTVPEGWTVAATGELVNADERLPAEARNRLEVALESDTVVRVLEPDDLAAGVRDGEVAGRAAAGEPNAGGATATWRFRADSVRDFAFAASDRYAWDAVGAEVGGPRGRVLVSALYDPSIEHWSEAARYSKHAVEFFSDYIFPYPYPHATAVYGPVGGMEYPMIVFIGRSRPGEPLYSVLAHEFSHEWFPMVVGSPEADFAWMDEGLTTFDEALARADFFDTDSARIQDMELYLRAVAADAEAPLMRHTDHVESALGRAVAAYMKPATLLHALRTVLGSETFDRAYRAYAEAWAYRHPYPWDFFRMMEAESGRELDWFWRPWFYETHTLDQAVEAVEPAADGVRITVRNLEDAVMPVILAVELEDGTARRVTWPAEVWAGTREVTRLVGLDGAPADAGEADGDAAPPAVVRVTIDPDRRFPDVDRENNRWPREGR